MPDQVLMVRDVLRRERCSLLQAGVAMLIYSICQTALPISMLMVIRCVESDDNGELQWLSEWTTADSMIYWILAYAIFQAGAAVANHWQLHAAFHVGQRVRAQLIMLVFQFLDCRAGLRHHTCSRVPGRHTAMVSPPRPSTRAMENDPSQCFFTERRTASEQGQGHHLQGEKSNIKLCSMVTST